jgi:pimeloyl-ACP methyl ester carboxylesterase/tetratricopeptide (TPR) repeat protein
MGQLKVHGLREAGAESRLPLLNEKIQLKDAVQIESVSREDSELLDLQGVEPTDVVEVELEDGTVIWTRVDALREATQDVRQRGDGEEVLTCFFPLAGSDRGLVSWAIKSLKFFDYDIAQYSALKVAHRVESQLAGPEGIYRIDANGDLTRDKIQPGSEKVLLFIHGTASSTDSAYCGLTRTPPAQSDNPDMTQHFKKLHAHYGGRVYGFEHKTLTETPAANALKLLQQLPRENIPPLHVVSHSRGGLVGDLLAHGGIDAFPDADLEAYNVPEEQRATYRSLSKALVQQKPRVERFIRIACPAAGTTLASGRLDIYLSIMVNLIGKIPAIGPFVEGFGDLVAAVAKERADPAVLPGLAAQMPTSALVRALNGSGQVLDTDLTVIAGNSGGFIKNLANLFYWTANDLVVDTRSMYGGAQRSQRRWYCAEGSEVDHVSYFRHEETVKKLVHGLTREPDDTSGFEMSKPKGAARGAAQQPQDNPEKPCVILLPGIMGSHLAVVEGDSDRDRIWLDPKSIMFGGIEHLDLAAKSTVEPDGLISLAYGDLIDYLRGEGGQHVIPFAYDWRLSVRQAAQRLDEIVTTRTSVSSAPIRIVAHSMGGLVARAYIAYQPERWELLVRQHDARLIQLGTPNGGSYVIPRILLGEETILRQLAALDLDKDINAWARIVAQFPGLLEMAPHSAAPDFFEPATWSKFAGIKAIPSPEALSAARTTVENLAAVDLSAHPVVYVAGHGASTPILAEDSDGRLRLGETTDGDGRVTWQSGIPQGVPTYYIPVEHGSMADDERSFDGIRELIESGKTGQFERNPLKPMAPPSRGLGPLAQEGADIFPDERALVTAALGMGTEAQVARAKPDEKRPATIVEVAHGDLAYARYPVMIGHYEGDTIMSAEAHIDRSLGGKLSQRNQLELYPGAIGTAEVVLRDKAAPSQLLPGAIVVGLGSVGTLTRGGLSNTVKSGLLRYVQEALDRGENTTALRVSTMLIGSGETGLTMEQVVESILTGLDLANRRLREVHNADGQVIAAIAGLEILELYLDTALQALHAATRITGLDQGISVKDTLRRLSGGEQRASFSESKGWWSRIVISSDNKQSKKPRKSHKLTFRVYGDRARADQLSLQVQRPLVDSMIASAMGSSRAPTEKLPQTLFELLLPHELKGSAADRQNLVVGVDPFSAQYPWEMLVDRYDATGRPLAVVAGLLRQLDVQDPPAVSHPEGRRILVVGDPPSSMQALPAAEKEAKAVADRFEKRGSDWHVIRQIRNDPGQPAIHSRSIIEEILTSDARILHVAGHGVYDPDDSQRTGAVIGADPNDPGKPVLFTPSLVRQMRLTPELVFINCCHLGRITDTPQHLLAANLATGFIEAGVRAVVAAGWAVDDHAAETFAASFYAAILSGAAFGEAVRTARSQTYRDHPQTNTWAAYQCYGNPGFQLLADPGVRKQAANPSYDRLLDPAEVEAQLSNLVSRVQARREVGDGSGRNDSKSQLDHIKNTARARGWADCCGVALAIARVHGELEEFAEAIQWFDKARAADDGSVTLRDLEQHANYMARRGADLADGSDAASREMGLALIDRAINDIDRVLDCGKTAERWAIRGSASKRKLKYVKARTQREQLLRSMTESYANAAELGATDWYYASSNALSGILLLGGPWDTPKHAIPLARTDQFQRALQEVRAHVTNLDIKSFWNAVADPDLRVIESLHDGTLGGSTDAIREGYLAVVNEHGLPHQLNSSLFQIDFLSDMFRELKPGEPGPLSTKKARDAAARALSKLRKELEARIRVK